MYSGTFCLEACGCNCIMRRHIQIENKLFLVGVVVVVGGGVKLERQVSRFLFLGMGRDKRSM